MAVEIREMEHGDYDEVHAVWRTSEGLSLGEDDERDRIVLYLARNRGLCFVAVLDTKIIGTVLNGHDGRRGIMRHLAVLSDYRGRGIARLLVNASLGALANAGIKKCNIFVMDYNEAGLRFWTHLGFYILEDDYRTLQFLTKDSTGPQSERPS